MFQSLRDQISGGLARLHERRGERIGGVALALLAEALLVLAVLSLGFMPEAKPKPGTRLVSIAVKAADDDAPQREPDARKATNPDAAKPEPEQRTKTPPDAAIPVALPSTPQPAPSPPAIIPISRNEMASLDISRVPRQPSAGPPRAMMGPVDTGSPGDSKRVGSAPNGEPLYAAQWYREPSDGELAGYLSTADGPGWALIACRTVADFRVEDCVGLDEYPSGSNMLRAVLAAAWQFRVRPPRKGGVSQVGAWVRIRIDYELRPRRG